MRVITICVALAVTALAGCEAPAPKESLPVATPVAPAAQITPVAAGAPAAEAQTAQITPTAAPIVQAEAEADDNEVVCRNEKPLGTRIGKRVCKTRGQFKLEEEAARQMMKNRDQKSHGVTDAITGH